MTRRQRTKLVEVRADLILGLEFSFQEYALHFETQMHRAMVRKFLYHSYLHFARAGAALVGLDPSGIM